MPDWASPEPSPAPFTTIGWRATHIGFVLHTRANHRFGDGSLTAMNAPWPGSAEAALSWMNGGFDAYRAGVEGLVDGELDVPPEGPPGYIDTRFPLAMSLEALPLRRRGQHGDGLGERVRLERRRVVVSRPQPTVPEPDA